MKNDDEYFNDEEFQEILNDYEQSVKSGKATFMDADDLTEIAEYYQQNERYDEAREALDRAVEINPNALGSGQKADPRQKRIALGRVFRIVVLVIETGQTKPDFVLRILKSGQMQNALCLSLHL